LQARPERHGIASDVVDQLLVRRAIDQEHFRILDGIDEVRGRGPSVEARRVGQPPGFGRELDDVLLAFRIDHVVAQTPAGDEGGVPDDVAAALQELTGRQRLVEKRGSDDRHVPIGEPGSRLQVCAEHVERLGRFQHVLPVHYIMMISDPCGSGFTVQGFRVQGSRRVTVTSA